MMHGKMTTIARPYAMAAFEFAESKNNLSAWETMLNHAAVLVQQPMMMTLLENPSIAKQPLVDLC